MSVTRGATFNDNEGTQGGSWLAEPHDQYINDYGRKRSNHDHLDTGIHVLNDGRIDIHIHEHDPEIARLSSQLQDTPASRRIKGRGFVGNAERERFPLRLNIVIQVIGSRGDIQPFIALGKELKAIGHRVRLATHLSFRTSVLSNNLEFFNIGGDPTELMAFMVNNSGLLPKFKTIRNGVIRKRRRDMRQIIDGCWHSCFETGDGTHLHQIKEDPWDETLDYRRRPFVADAIIANPPGLAHIHCAQRLGIPLHIMFTMPWSPTQSFPHPLTIIHLQDCKPSVANFLSYAVVDMMIWQGLGDLVNKFRKTCLSLDPLDAITGSSLIHRLQIPCTYLWSPSLLPKPRDWPDHIDVCGFSFLPSKSDYIPPLEVTTFLQAGRKPIYVGFGSIVVNNQTRLVDIILKAIKYTGQRAIISSGWAGLGVDKTEFTDNVLIIGSVPHDWLFQHVSCVVHHGGAGTTAAGLALGRPTVIVPFFGDQQFWGNVVARAGAGPAPIPYRQLTAEKLADAIKEALTSGIQERSRQIGDKMQHESGSRDGARSFHGHLELRRMQCAICPNRPAVWRFRHSNVSLSAFAAEVLVERGKIMPQDLFLYRSTEYDTYRDPAEPIGAIAGVMLGAATNFITRLADLPAEILSEISSAGSALRKPREHFDPYFQCQSHQIDRQEETIAREESDDEDDEHENEDESENENQAVARKDKNQQRNSNFSSETGPSLKRRAPRLSSQQSVDNKTTLSRTHMSFPETAFIASTVSRKLLRLIVWFPAELSLSLARGFRNTPLVYHDPMVKPTPKVTDIRSGFKAAGQVYYALFFFWEALGKYPKVQAQELKAGLYDGITGLVTQPRYSLKHHGIKNMISGLGKGIGGLFLKPIAGVLGLAGYPLNGLRKELNTSLNKPMERYVESSRIAQGREEIENSTMEDRLKVIEKWTSIEETLQGVVNR